MICKLFDAIDVSVHVAVICNRMLKNVKTLIVDTADDCSVETVDQVVIKQSKYQTVSEWASC